MRERLEGDRQELIRSFLQQQIELAGSWVVRPRGSALPAGAEVAGADGEAASSPALEADSPPAVTASVAPFALAQAVAEAPTPTGDRAAAAPPVASEETGAEKDTEGSPPAGGKAQWRAPDGRWVRGTPRRIALAKLFYEVRGCLQCELGPGRTKFVFGMGASDPEVVLVGEAPGFQEDRTGLPFVGPAGKLLDQLLEEVGLSRRDSAFILNVLKCRPPGNRDPLPHEVARCSPILIRQLEILEPRVICAVGRFAVHALLGTESPLGALRGRRHTYRGVPLIATYHPAYVLRNPDAMDRVREDFRAIRGILSEPRAAEVRP